MRGWWWICWGPRRDSVDTLPTSPSPAMIAARYMRIRYGSRVNKQTNQEPNSKKQSIQPRTSPFPHNKHSPVNNTRTHQMAYTLPLNTTAPRKKEGVRHHVAPRLTRAVSGLRDDETRRRRMTKRGRGSRSGME